MHGTVSGGLPALHPAPHTCCTAQYQAKEEPLDSPSNSQVAADLACCSVRLLPSVPCMPGRATRLLAAWRVLGNASDPVQLAQLHADPPSAAQHPAGRHGKCRHV